MLGCNSSEALAKSVTCSKLCRRDPDAFVPGSTVKPYLFTQAIQPDAALSSMLHQQCVAVVGADKALQGFNVTADSFYSSQVGTHVLVQRHMPGKPELQRRTHLLISQQIQDTYAIYYPRLHIVPLVCT